MKTQKLLLTIALAGATTIMATDALAKKGDRSTGRNAPMGMTPTIYVYGQDLVYDTILLTEVPYNGTDNFQALEFDGPTGVQTEFGPGDVGYVGGRIVAWGTEVVGVEGRLIFEVLRVDCLGAGNPSESEEGQQGKNCPKRVLLHGAVLVQCKITPRAYKRDRAT